MTTSEPAPRPRSFTAALWLRESLLRDAQRISDREERAAAIAQVDHDHPMPTRATHRRNPR